MHFIYPAFLITFTAPLSMLCFYLGIDMPLYILVNIAAYATISVILDSFWEVLHPVELTLGLTDLIFAVQYIYMSFMI